jgi:L,D-peptidoglycan transpeptidase YkuD (ErfK/YbiS/YcfS/YnhG family)
MVDKGVTTISQCVSKAAILAFVAVSLAGCVDPPMQSRCAEALQGINRLIVVLTKDVHSVEATVITLERATPAEPWRLLGRPAAAVVGGKGLGWGQGFQDADTDGVGLKAEGDKKTPAGVYRVGQPFGFAPASFANYMQLVTGEHICVDDVSSEHYGRIISRQRAGLDTSGEAMREIEVYRNGIVVDYPSDRSAKSGSCIFLHIWTEPGEGTSGCVALSEQDIQHLQAFSSDQPTAIAIWPWTSGTHLQSCIGALPTSVLNLKAETM